MLKTSKIQSSLVGVTISPQEKGKLIFYQVWKEPIFIWKLICILVQFKEIELQIGIEN